MRSMERLDWLRKSKTGFFEGAKTIFMAILLALFIRTFFLQAFKIPTGSMEPTLHGAQNYGWGDRIFVNKIIYGISVPFTKKRLFTIREPQRGDVVVFKTNGINSLPPHQQNKDFIKRVVAVGGERLLIKDGKIYINGKPLEEPIEIASRFYMNIGSYGEGEVEVPEGHYFVLGDNSPYSRDSRYWGFVPYENVLGKAFMIWFPPSRIQFIR